MQQTLFGDVEYKYVNGNLMKINAGNILDQYFTDEKLAINLFEKAKSIIGKYEEDISIYTWIEPSAGNGVFYDLFPHDKRIGIDISPQRDDILKSDYLFYQLPKGKSIVMGNPPFGHRGVMALNFINHSQQADYVCFILPMFFESKGKGSVKYRVRNFNLIHSERLPNNSFYIPHKEKKVDVKCVFQVWSKNHKLDKPEFSWYNNKKQEPFSDIIRLYTVSLAKKRECGKRWIFDEKADYYISSTFHDNVSVVDSFDKVKYKSGIAIVFTTDNEEIKEKLKRKIESADWRRYGSLATNSCYHLGKSNIFEFLQDNFSEYEFRAEAV